MKKKIIVLLILALGCGFEPFPPFGCINPHAQCVCDSHDNCQWIWLCR